MKKLLFILSIAVCLNANAQIITTIAGNGTAGYSGDGGQATNAELHYPKGIACDISGNIYFADYNNNRVRKINTSGIITTFAGNGTAGFSGDGGQATNAKLNAPEGVTLDAAGNLYIADLLNNCIRKVNTAGIISTIAGNGAAGYSGDGAAATAAELYYPQGVAVDAAGNLYIADENNNRIRKINTAGIISTIVGNGTAAFSGDGGVATAAEINLPYGVACDTIGNLYIADQGNARIRKVNTTGIISTVAGNGIQGYSGDGGAATTAELYYPRGVVVDATGNLYIADLNNNVIRKVDTSGIITTIAGNGFNAGTGNGGYSGDGGAATAAELNGSRGIAFDAVGNMYIADTYNNRIRKVTNVVAGIAITQNSENKIIIYPNPTSDQFFIEANASDKLNVDLYDVNGRHVFSANVSDKSNINVTTLDNGSYTLTIKTADRVTNKKLVILR